MTSYPAFHFGWTKSPDGEGQFILWQRGRGVAVASIDVESARGMRETITHVLETHRLEEEDSRVKGRVFLAEVESLLAGHVLYVGAKVKYCIACFPEEMTPGPDSYLDCDVHHLREAFNALKAVQA